MLTKRSFNLYSIEQHMPRKANDGKSISKAAAYRDAEAKFGPEGDLQEVSKYIQESFGLEMDKNQISQYRSLERGREKKGPGKKRGRKPKSKAATAPVVAVAAKETATKSDPMIQFISTIRGFESKMGADKVHKIFEALYKS